MYFDKHNMGIRIWNIHRTTRNTFIFYLIPFISLSVCFQSRIFNVKQSCRNDRSNSILMLNTVPPKTQFIFDKLESDELQVGGAGGSSSLKGLVQLENSWEKLKKGSWKNEVNKIVSESERVLEELSLNYDVIVIGGTLGIFYAAALQKLGRKVCVIERGKIAGRSQEWNISKKELFALQRIGIITSEELSAVISIEFNPVRVGFKSDTSVDATDKGFEVYTNDVLNLGIKPNFLIDVVKRNYELLGGAIYENSAVEEVNIYENIASVTVRGNSTTPDPVILTSRLIIDAMGNASPIAKQIRGPVEPDGICGMYGLLVTYVARIC